MSFTGRVDRRTFIYSQIVLAPLIYLALGLCGAALSKLNSDFPTKGMPQTFKNMTLTTSSATVLAWGAGIIGAVLLIAILSFVVRRLHDLDFSGWFLVLWPFLGFLLAGFDTPDTTSGSILEAVLILVPGTAGANDHGPDPRPFAIAARAAGRVLEEDARGP